VERIFLFVCAICAIRVLAAPTITGLSGTVTHGSTVIISGSGFGTKSTAAPMKYDDFESGAVGENIGNGWNLIVNQPPSGVEKHFPIYSTNVLRPNSPSTRSAQARFDDAGLNCSGEGCRTASNFGFSGHYEGSNQIGSTPGLKLPVIFVDAWVFYANANPESRNVKMIRVHSNSYRPNMYFNIYCFSDTDGARLGQDSDAGSVTNIILPSNPWRGSSFFAGNWRHFQMYLAQSTAGQANGTAVLAINNKTSIDRTNMANATDDTHYWDTLWFGNWVGHDGNQWCTQNSPGNTYTYWDNVYVDTTRSHVEIGDASTYVANTHTEIQIPTAWSANSVSVSINRGSFTSGTVYLYVVDSTGAVNANGYPVTLGGDLTRPKMPTGLRVQ
jgi:hypothetical protein